MVETQFLQAAWYDTLNPCFIYDMVFVKYTWLSIHCFTIFKGGRSRVFSSLGTATLWTYFSAAVCEAAGPVDVCICEKQERIRTFVGRLINCSCSCRNLHVDHRMYVDRGAGAAAAVGSGRTFCWIFSIRRAPRTARRSRRC